MTCALQRLCNPSPETDASCSGAVAGITHHRNRTELCGARSFFFVILKGMQNVFNSDYKYFVPQTDSAVNVLIARNILDFFLCSSQQKNIVYALEAWNFRANSSLQEPVRRQCPGDSLGFTRSLNNTLPPLVFWSQPHTVTIATIYNIDSQGGEGDPWLLPKRFAFVDALIATVTPPVVGVFRKAW